MEGHSESARIQASSEELFWHITQVPNTFLRNQLIASPSHSSTTERRNALICIRVDTESEASARNILKGYGEIGLPPKKISAGYLADYDDGMSPTNLFFSPPLDSPPCSVDSYCGAFFAWV